VDDRAKPITKGRKKKAQKRLAKRGENLPSRGKHKERAEEQTEGKKRERKWTEGENEAAQGSFGRGEREEESRYDRPWGVWGVQEEEKPDPRKRMDEFYRGGGGCVDQKGGTKASPKNGQAGGIERLHGKKRQKIPRKKCAIILRKGNFWSNQPEKKRPG